MTYPSALSSVDLEKLKAFDSCTISNAIACLNVLPVRRSTEPSSLVLMKRQVRVR
jgi:hypothetical protein